MGDAAALFDAGKAADLFRRALAGYEAAGKEPDTFLGAHLTYTAQHFLPAPPEGAAPRVKAKMHHWLDHT